MENSNNRGKVGEKKGLYENSHHKIGHLNEKNKIYMRDINNINF